MMRLVVTEGTGTNADVAGELVLGKTGSAEWSETEPTHAWFIGYLGRSRVRRRRGVRWSRRPASRPRLLRRSSRRSPAIREHSDRRFAGW